MQDKMARLRWQCRRGMLELDAILQPFFEQQFSSLTNEEQADFEYLLTRSDHELYQWLVKGIVPEEPRLVSILASIVKYENRSI